MHSVFLFFFFNHIVEQYPLQSKKLQDLFETIVDIVVSSYGVGCRFANENLIFRMNKYSAPAKGEPAQGLTPHIDGSSMTILCQNEVDGLLLKSKEGEWMRASPGNSFVVFAGNALKVSI